MPFRVLRAYINEKENAPKDHTCFNNLDGLIVSPNGTILTNPRGISSGNNLLRVLPTYTNELRVEVCNLEVNPKPIAVSLCMKKQNHDKRCKPLIVLEFPDEYQIGMSTGGESIINRFPTYDLFLPYRKATREDDMLRLLMISRSINLEEIARDREQIRQTLVIATPEEVEPWMKALTGL